MNRKVLNRINRYLASMGLAQMEDPRGLLSQLGFMVRDHEHFRSLLNACEPENRSAMYDSLAPNLQFKPYPLDVYLAQVREQAAAEQLPTIASDGSLKPYLVPKLKTKPCPGPDSK